MQLHKRLLKKIKSNESLYFILRYVWIRSIKIFFGWVPDEAFLRAQYRLYTGKRLNLKQPELFNEKMQAFKLRERNPMMHALADKSEVRSYVRDTVGEKYLTKLYGVYDRVEDVDFDALPDQFVMKLTNGSGFNDRCFHKTEAEIKKIRMHFSCWRKIDFFYLGREWAYKGVPNRILCEEMLVGEEPYGLNDYKVFCFNGEPQLIQVYYSRFVSLRANFYTPTWEFVDEKVVYDNDPNAQIPKPRHLEEMLSCARRLSAPFSQVRVDFYSVGDRLVFGEMTFYHGAGYLKFDSEDFERQLGANWRV